MTEGFFIEQDFGPSVTAFFAEGGVLEPRGDVWIYERDGRSSVATDPYFAVIGAEGNGKGILVWNGE
jgi:hypothetical protein